MQYFATPDAAALDVVGAPEAVVARVVVNGDLAGVVVVDARWVPPIERALVVEQTIRGWRQSGGGTVGGAQWNQRSVVLTASVGPEVDSAIVTYGGLEHRVPARDGYVVYVSAATAGEEMPDLTTYTTRDGGSHSGWPPRPVQTTETTFEPRIEKALGDARHWVWATQRQIERFVAGMHAQALGILPPTPDEQRANSGSFADAQFLLNAANHAKKALDRLGRVRLSEALVQAIATLRNVHEHWESERRTFEDATIAKQRSGKKFAERYPDAVPWQYGFGSDGHHISVLRLEDLWDELDGIDRALSALFNDVMAASRQPHMPEDPGRPPRPMPVPVADKFPRVVGVSMATQDLVIPSDGQALP